MKSLSRYLLLCVFGWSTIFAQSIAPNISTSNCEKPEYPSASKRLTEEGTVGDPRERNSPYTKHLVKAMQSPNKPIEQVFKEVRRALQDETKNQQTTWENTSLSGDFYFKVQR